ncbi:Molybdopterin synthase catalytic subunit [BD1-7 clade bacterium]|uniref:Molybdopterin synthase catalytic subunit n=1 Tax=BD1-7 clade bacterium TaxID=2029982 RepID=A0A5S9QR33_9GAMM|nr:Molybdopterin synthase catalytic subunit [BD1-7 clade bacterium]CAA0120630.1 Molybdopterin synthase catalytic subunit [BD1-7 clade bacterium]
MKFHAATEPRRDVWLSIQSDSLDNSAYLAWLRCAGDSVGAVAEFTGFVRADGAGESSIVAIELEHYPEMAEAAIRNIILQAQERWPIQRVAVVHRVGRLKVGEDIVYMGVSSAHRAAAFSAVDFIMDFLKNDVPIWKKAVLAEKEQWIEQKKSDKDAKNRW